MALHWVGVTWKAIHEICLVRCGVSVHHAPRVTPFLTRVSVTWQGIWKTTTTRAELLLYIAGADVQGEARQVRHPLVRHGVRRRGVDHLLRPDRPGERDKQHHDRGQGRHERGL